MASFVDSALLLGIGGSVGWAFKRMELGRTAKTEAGDLIAELSEVAWRSGEGSDWQRLQIFLIKMRVRLGAAGMPKDAVEGLAAVVVQHWESVHEVGNDDEGQPVSRVDYHLGNDLGEAMELAMYWCFGTRSPLARRRARARIKELGEKYP